MSTRGRSNIESSSLSKQRGSMPEGVSKALDMINENAVPEEKPVAEESTPPVSGNLRELVLFGKMTKDIFFGGYKVKLSTLSNKQQRDIVKRLMKLDSEERLLNVKIFTLAESVVSINEVPIDEVAKSSKEPFESRVELIANWQFSLVDRLYNKYEEILKESNSVFDSSDLEEKIKN